MEAYPKEWLNHARLDIKYAGYLEKEKRAAARNAKMEAIKLDKALDYRAIPGLSAESREKLSQVHPLTLGQAARIPGVRQGDIALLMVLAGDSGLLRNAPVPEDPVRSGSARVPGSPPGLGSFAGTVPSAVPARGPAPEPWERA